LIDSADAIIMKKAELIFNGSLVLVDYLMLVLAAAVAYNLRASSWLKDWRDAGIFFEHFSFEQYFGAALLIAAGWIVIFALAGLYQTKINRGTFEDFVKILISCSAGVMLITIIIFFRKDLFDSRFIVIAGWFFGIVFVTLGRLAMRAVWRKQNFGRRDVVLIGGANITRQIKNELENNPYYCSRVVKEIDGSAIGDIEKCLLDAACDEIIVCNSDYPRETVAAVANYCEEKQIDFRFIPDSYQTFFTNVNVETVAGFPVLELKRTPLEGWGRFAKRTADIIIAAVSLAVFAPVALIAALAIKIDSPGPVIVKLKRVSKGKEFDLYKFRSMQNNAHLLKNQLTLFNERGDGPLFKIKNDPRITRVGKFIRKTWIDEIPQLVNVIRGEISLVGPRPHEPEEVNKYQNHQKKVFLVKAGMTGLSQVNGGWKLKFDEEIKLDLYYVKNWSMFWDFKILLKTAVLFFKPKDDC